MVFSNVPGSNNTHLPFAAFSLFNLSFFHHFYVDSCLLLGTSTTIDWAKSHNYPQFSTAKMEDTRFLDLKVKVGYPYLYCHQGDCEHLVIITDVRSAACCKITYFF